MKKIFYLFLGVMCFLSFITPLYSQTVYTWSVLTGAWTDSASWTPARTTPATSDVLIFNGNIISNALVTDVPHQTVASISVINNSYATLSTTNTLSSVTVTLGLGASTTFFIEAGSTFKISGAHLIAIHLATTNFGFIDGDLIFNATAAAIPHRFLVQTVDGLIIRSGGTVAMAPVAGGAEGGFGASGGTPGSIANSVRFLAGSHYYQGGLKDGTRNGGTGANPFGLSAPLSYVIFDPGSFYTTWDSIPSMSGRTYANFIWRNRFTQSHTGTSPTIILNDYIIRNSLSDVSGRQNYNLTTVGTTMLIHGNFIVESNSGGFSDGGAPASLSRFIVKGNIDIQNPAIFIPNANVNRVYTLEANTVQSVNFANEQLVNLTVNNPAGINLLSSVTVANALTLENGIVSTGANNIILGTSPTATGTLPSGAGLISGNFTRWISTATGPRSFPLAGPPNRTAVVDFTVAPTVGGTLTARFISLDPGENGLPLTDGAIQLVNVAPEGHWSITGAIDGTYNLQLNAAEFHNLGDVSTLRVLRRGSAILPWTLAGSAGVNVGTVIERTGLTGFSQFAIAGVDGQVPVELSEFHIE